MSVSVKTLWENRSTIRDGKRVPTFWNPEPIKGIETEIPEVIQKMIALGLVLELEVGKFVQDEVRNHPEFGKNDNLMKLLQSNIADEARHEKGFRYANDVLPSHEYIRECEIIRDRAQDLTDVYSDITVAALLEIGVFLPSLAVMRLFGGRELSIMATKIAVDESRHTAINGAISSRLGDPIPQIIHGKAGDFVADCLAFLFWDMPTLTVENVDVNYKLIKEESDSLLSDGVSIVLDNLAGYAQFLAPFENENNLIYDRAL